MAIGLSTNGKWVVNKACTTPWCHAVVHFEVKMRRFSAVFEDSIVTMVGFAFSFPRR